jgi:hypothetical protein
VLPHVRRHLWLEEGTVQRFIAVHTVPFTEEALVKYAKEDAPEFPKSGLLWLRTYGDFSNDKHFCEWEASNQEVLEAIFQKLDIPYDAMHPVQIFDVATAKLEA